MATSTGLYRRCPLISTPLAPEWPSTATTASSFRSESKSVIVRRCYVPKENVNDSKTLEQGIDYFKAIEPHISCRDIPVEQLYDRTSLKRSDVRPWDEM